LKKKERGFNILLFHKIFESECDKRKEHRKINNGEQKNEKNLILVILYVGEGA
jgi:hypothetical protein